MGNDKGSDPSGSDQNCAWCASLFRPIRYEATQIFPQLDTRFPSQMACYVRSLQGKFQGIRASEPVPEYHMACFDFPNSSIFTIIVLLAWKLAWQSWQIKRFFRSILLTSFDQVRIATLALKVHWYRGTFYNATVLGLCNFCAPGLWGAMNSLGAGGAQAPYLVNTANALTFCLMVVSCYFSSVLTKYITIKGALIFGTLGYAPYAAGLYCNNRFGTEWLVLLGAALCGISAGVFWASEAAIAIAYPEPHNKGKVLGYWLTYRLGGQILGGAINLGLNADADEAGKVSYKVYLVFIALQCCGPLVALFLTPPGKVERTDSRKVDLSVLEDPITELKHMTKLFFSKQFLLVILFIGQAVYSEAVFFTYLSLWFTVRSRALGSFLSGIVAVTAGNLLGFFLDRTSIPLYRRSRIAFGTIVTLQGAWWVWVAVLATRFHFAEKAPVYDWSSPGFGAAFAVFVFLTMGFQLNYLFCYFLMGQLAKNEAEVIRYAALLRGTESAWQAVSYGLNSIPIFASVGGIYINFGLWAVAIGPVWLVVRHFGK